VDGPAQFWRSIERNLNKLIPSYTRTWPDYIEEAREAFSRYMFELEMIQWYYHPTPWKRQRLSETEVFLQCIQVDPSNRYLRGRSDFLSGLKQAYGGLVDVTRSQVTVTVEGRYQRAAAFIHVGFEYVKGKRKDGESFAWIIVPELYEAWQRVKDNGYVDGDLLEDEVGWTEGGQHVNTSDTILDIQRKFGIVL
jgi:hypothetical protein